MERSKAAIRKSSREIERTIDQLLIKCEERMIEAKAMAKKGQVGVANIMAKDIVRMEGAVEKLYILRTQMDSVGITILSLKATADMTSAMKDAAKGMAMINNQIKLPQLRQIMMTFEKELEMMGDKQTMMDETVDSVTTAEGDEEKQEKLLERVMDEIGIGVVGGMADAPRGVRHAVGNGNGPVNEVPADLRERLDALRK